MSERYSVEALRQIIRTALQLIDKWSPEAEELVLGTAAQESHLGEYDRQLGGGPALGIWQMEPATERDRWENYLAYRKELREAVIAATGISGPNLGRLQHDPIYGAIMCRVRYLSVREPLPPDFDIQAQAFYWKQHYNTKQGKGRPEEYVTNYYRLVMGQHQESTGVLLENIRRT